MIDYILDNMIVNKRLQHALARELRTKNLIEYTVCEEVAHEQRLAPEKERDMIKKEAKTLEAITDFTQLTSIANEMIDRGVLDLDEGGGDTMVAYEALANQTQNLFITERIVVSDDNGLKRFCENHNIQIVDGNNYALALETLRADSKV